MATNATQANQSALASPRIRFNKVANGKIVNHGYMDVDDAEKIFVQVLKHWGISSSNEDGRDALLTSLAEALLQGTSSERDYANVTFEHGEEICSLDQLEFLAAQFTVTDNPLRVWARSFRNGEMAARCYGLLTEPNNSTLREKAAYRYGAPMDKVGFCFDFADALIDYGFQLSHDERNFIRSSRAMKTDDALSRARARGGTRAPADGSGTLGGVSRDIAPVQAVSQDARANFPSLR